MLRIENISKRFANGFIALDNLNLTVDQGEIISLVGTSGCGKSTLLRIISGLEYPTVGEVFIDDEAIHSPHPKIGLIFQEPRLMLWLTVRENVEFGLDTLPNVKFNRLERRDLVDRILERVSLTEFANTLPRQLSGGMAQRVAIARALITKPSILLLDESFSALDAFIRMKLQDHLLSIWDYDRPTLVLVTHDIEEADFSR
jgi:sulfonate transport system ATP-binding protein